MIPEEEYAPWKWEPQHLGSAFAVLLTYLERQLYNLGVISRCGIHEIVSLSWWRICERWRKYHFLNGV